MWLEERHQRIRDLLSVFHRITTDRIAEDLGVSRETIRRDLIELEQLGALKRVHGGAVLIQEEAEPPFDERAMTRVRDKRALARAALRLVKSGDVLFLDAGSTVSILAEELATLRGLHIVTNSFDVGMRMNTSRAERGHEIIMLGGQFGENLPATFGEITVGEIHRYHVDSAILSPVGLDAERGATSYDHREAEVARAMIGNCDRVILLADYSKIGLTSRVTYCAAERVNCLVTNNKAREQPGFAALAEKLPEIILAD